ncbi:N-acetylated-alpha-linked acidic dipeptidase [Jatrophihabitans endophyticus]|uniref:N-acetylated-alpha-linked acidic dipeptidase n=1 Tax=Jatrophihabitans endophyticus TaxID=1206085 RepID=A0A1M5HKZ9_9ACTN|nr:M28 family peptidase [Jatrophihabitans endophyticus]SHG16633.1 N-acetylated-alpha-linked acidic dipeptidase [Jatrophihabitans endophyticus]
MTFALHPHRRTAGRVAALALSVLTLAAGTPAHAASRPTLDRFGALVASRTSTAAAVADLAVLQRIAQRDHGNRATGTRGYRDSQDFAVRRLRAAGYRVQLQPVPYTKFHVSAERTRLQLGARTVRLTSLLMDESPARRVTNAPLVAPADGPTAGCQAADFAGQDVSGAVVLEPRASCGYAAQLAVAAGLGATAVLLSYPTPRPQNVLRLHWFDSTPPAIPLASIRHTDETALRAALARGPIRVDLDWRGHDVSGVTHTVIAETRGGSAHHVVMFGGHLDSVDEGPGINDNGSAVAAVLETAVALAPFQDRLRNRVRFVLWGAEELVDVGSDHYVAQLDAQQRADIDVYVNAEMIASDNFVRFVMAGAGIVSAPFEAYYAARDLPIERVGSDAVGSDQEPFFAAGIPIAGLFDGALGVKTPAQAAVYGGRAGQLYASCYHQACDTLAAIDRRALEQSTHGLAYAVATLAGQAAPGAR